MVPHGSRIETRVDPDEQHPKAGRNQIRDPFGPGFRQLGK
jgi:hypothetical protein